MKLKLKQAISGFTMVEMLVVIAIIGILAAIVAPSWLAMLARQRVNAAQAEALTAFREAQANAKREKRVWQACFREFADPSDQKMRTQWSVQPVTANNNGKCNLVTDGNWNNLIGADADLIAIDTFNSNLPEAPAGHYKVQFQYKGLVGDSQLPGKKITFGIRRDSGRPGVTDGTKRCIFVQTLLGALSAGSNDECSL